MRVSDRPIARDAYASKKEQHHPSNERKDALNSINTFNVGPARDTIE